MTHEKLNNLWVDRSGYVIECKLESRLADTDNVLLGRRVFSSLKGVLEISCQSDRILNSKGRKDEREVRF